MRVTVFFYEPIDSESILYSSLKRLFEEYKERFSIGNRIGFGATGLSWRDAYTLATKIVATILKTEPESVFKEMRLLVQEDERNT